MANMRTLIRIVFVIFIAKGFDSLGSNNCCNFPKYENITKDENITAESLVNTDWYNAKKNNLVLKIFVKENGIFTSKGNENKLNENNNTKITAQNEAENKFKLKDKKYALFEIKTKDKNTVYLYCSDIESSENNNGIFNGTNHVSISVIACDTEKVTHVEYMFYNCSSLKELDLNNFNTTNVTDMHSMFSGCSSLKEIDLKNFNVSKVKDMGRMFYFCEKLITLGFWENFNTINVTNMEEMFNNCTSLKKLDLNNFNTTNVTNMCFMFYKCSSLTELDISNFNTINVMEMMGMFCDCKNLKKLELGKKFNTKNVTNMAYMFYGCKNLEKLNLNNFNTEKVTNMSCMFFKCSSLTKLEIGKNFNTTEDTDVKEIFEGCDKLSDDIKNEFSNKNK